MIFVGPMLSTASHDSGDELQRAQGGAKARLGREQVLVRTGVHDLPRLEEDHRVEARQEVQPVDAETTHASPSSANNAS